MKMDPRIESIKISALIIHIQVFIVKIEPMDHIGCVDVVSSDILSRNGKSATM
jgi:hypothetical protein